MGSRPAAYVSFKEPDYGITLDFRVHARYGTSVEVILNEAAMSYADLVDAIKERWGDDKRKPNAG